MSIQPLPPEVVAQIKSSTTITSLNGVICELVQNSLDAACTKIDVSVDYTRGCCVVEDDGLGIHPAEFGEDGGLGKLYHSSKLNSQIALHGRRGIFLTALSAMALMSITSHHHLHRSHNTISMHKSEVVSRQTPAPPQQYLSHPNHGTRVTIRDLFGNMPVRVKQRAIAAEKQKGNHRDWEELRRDVVLLLISWPKYVAVTVREVGTTQKITIRPTVHFNEPGSITGADIPRICSILTQVDFILPDEKTSWVPVGISTPSLEIRGTISLKPNAVKHVQFISFGVHPLRAAEGQSILHDEINRLFLNSSFGNEEELSNLDDEERARRARDQRFRGDEYTQKELKGGRKGVDRWPMFYIVIRQLTSTVASTQVDPDGILDDTGNSLSTIAELLEVMITEFLTEHHFRPRPGRGHRTRRKAEIRSEIRPQNQSPSKARDSSRPIAAHAGKISSKNSKANFDPLGTNVKLPSFLCSSREESPLDGWSKIKSGTLTSREKRDQLRAVSEVGASIARPFSAPPLRSSTQPLAKDLIISRPTSPLIAKDGKLLHRPFDDVVAARRRSIVKSAPIPSPEATISSIDSEDDLVAWINPTTKVKSIVNRRTGLTVPIKNEVSGGSIHRLSTRLSFSSHETIKSSTATKTGKQSTWISDLLQKWENPVFSSVEPSIPQVSLEGPDEHTQSLLRGRHHHGSQVDIDRAFKESSACLSVRISKSALKDAEIISQVDRKFILIKVQPMNSPSDPGDCGSMLVLVDQHAADERIRIESLMEELCTSPAKNVSVESPILTALLNKPLIFEISPIELQVLKAQIPYFANWGILYELASSGKSSDVLTANSIYCLSVRSLPPGITKRCKQEPRLLIELIRTEAWKAHKLGEPVSGQLEGQQTWLQRIQTCPQGILDMLNSRACRGAIMFNDELSRAQCETLVRQLAGCKFPFQCAHGRPSVVPLVDTRILRDINRSSGILGESEGSGLGEAFRKWKERGV